MCFYSYGSHKQIQTKSGKIYFILVVPCDLVRFLCINKNKHPQIYQYFCSLHNLTMFTWHLALNIILTNRYKWRQINHILLSCIMWFRLRLAHWHIYSLQTRQNIPKYHCILFATVCSFRIRLNHSNWVSIGWVITDINYITNIAKYYQIFGWG